MKKVWEVAASQNIIFEKKKERKRDKETKSPMGD